MKANVQISAVKKEFKNGQQGWQVFVQGMEGKLQCKMTSGASRTQSQARLSSAEAKPRWAVRNFTSALKAMRYSFLLSKKLQLQINDIQLAALSLDYQRAKEAMAQVAEDATQVANEVAADAGAEQVEPSDDDASEGAPEEQAVADSPLFKQFCDLKKKHPDALILFRCGDSYECYEEDAIKAAEVLCLTDVHSTKDNVTMAAFPHHALDTYLPKLIRHGIRVAICDDITTPAKPKSKRSKKAATIQPTEIVEPNEKCD